MMGLGQRSNMLLRLEDNAEDVIGKAQSGLGLSDGQLAKEASLGIDAILRLQNGEVDEAALRAVAGPLQINADALIALARHHYLPKEINLTGLLSFTTPYPVPGYEEMTVNAYIVYDPVTREAIAFDTGADASPMINALHSHGLTLKLILLTHSHGDHIKDLLVLKNQTGQPPAYISPKETIESALPLEKQQLFNLGQIGIRALDTSGHSPGGTSFVIQGLEQTVAIVGDAIFAGSMGGAAGAWQQALRNNRDKIMTLPPETILCPGHGPLTTVAQEKANNPFFAD